MFSILIPTYNNLNYLKLCIESIEKNSSYKHQIIVHINEGIDGSLNYIQEKGYQFTYSKENIGMPQALNRTSKLAKFDYILISHDDFYYCPLWDEEFKKEIELLNHNNFYLSANTMFHLKDEHNESLKKINIGNTIDLFDENTLLKNLDKFKTIDWQGTTKCPGLVHIDVWKKVNGWSEEFFPTGGDDTDFAVKLWKLNIRVFKGLGKSFVYHFGSITTRKKNNNSITYLGSKANKIFIKKWGISVNFFEKFYLKSGLNKHKKLIIRKYDGPLTEPTKNINYYFELFVIKLKLIFLILIK